MRLKAGGGVGCTSASDLLTCEDASFKSPSDAIMPGPTWTIGGGTDSRLLGVPDRPRPVPLDRRGGALVGDDQGRPGPGVIEGRSTSHHSKKSGVPRLGPFAREVTSPGTT